MIVELFVFISRNNDSEQTLKNRDKQNKLKSSFHNQQTSTLI